MAAARCRRRSCRGTCHLSCGLRNVVVYAAGGSGSIHGMERLRPFSSWRCDRCNRHRVLAISARDLDSILADVHLRFICFGGRCNQPGDNLGYALVLEITEFPRITLRSMRATALPRPDSQPSKSNRPAQVCAGGVGREFLADRAVRAIHLHVAEIAPEPAALAGL